jgi:hypothetical protein
MAAFARSKEAIDARSFAIFGLAFMAVGLLVVLVWPYVSVGQYVGAVKSGRSVETVDWYWRVPVPIQAADAAVAPSQPSAPSAIADLATRRLYYLGKADGIVVLYDSEGHRAIYVPADLVVLTVK